MVKNLPLSSLFILEGDVNNKAQYLLAYHEKDLVLAWLGQNLGSCRPMLVGRFTLNGCLMAASKGLMVAVGLEVVMVISWIVVRNKVKR